MLSKYYVHTRKIKYLLGQQYKGKGNRNVDELKAEIEKLLPEGKMVEINPVTGYLCITIKHQPLKRLSQTELNDEVVS